MENETTGNRLTHDAYVRAERFLPWKAGKLAFQTSVEPRWIEGTSRFWYRNETRNGTDFVMVDADDRLKESAFDQMQLAASMTSATGEYYVHNKLPFSEFELKNETNNMEFAIGDERWSCDLATYRCEPVGTEDNALEHESLSPDGKWAVYTREYDLYIRSTVTGEEHALTSDGEQYYDYGSLPEGRTTAVTDRLKARPIPPMLAWSPDSKRFVTYRLDQREVDDMHLVQSLPFRGGRRPELHSYRFAIVGDEHVPLADLLIFDVEHLTRIDVKHKPLISVAGSPISKKMVWWSESCRYIYFIEEERGYTTARVCIADAESGETRVILREESTTYVDTSPYRYPPNARTLANDADLIWWSERDGWGHLYRYSIETGEIENQITSGPWQVDTILHIDERERYVYFTGRGREAERDVYFRHLYRIRLDGSGLELLTPEDADHDISFSPSGEYFVDTFSTVNTPPIALLRASDGQLVMELEQSDLGMLEEAGWKKPERFRVKARDGVTDIFGVMFFPSDFAGDQNYPVIDYTYPGPQQIQTPKRFPPADSDDGKIFWYAQSVAELGFVVVILDGMGTPFRSKLFHTQMYGENFYEAGGQEDHVTGIRQLARSRPYMDLERVGMFGHSGGGWASTMALTRYPKFYKVAVSSAGAYDHRRYLAAWGERYIGIPESEDDFERQATYSVADKLQGKLLLICGEMDDNCHPSMLLQVVDALIKSNRDFDFLMLPNRNHYYTHDPYYLRRLWDYFVRHLQGTEPPCGYRIAEPPTDFLETEKALL